MSEKVLMTACDQWMNRPADQRFKSLEELHAATTHHREASREAHAVPYASLRVERTDLRGAVDAPVLVGKAGTPAEFTHYSFGQLARNVGAPASYLRTLPPKLAADALNYGLSHRPEGASEHADILFAQNGSLVVRAMTSDKYTRIWNNDISARLIRLTQQSPEWQPAPAAFDGSRGLYASEKDMFAFLVDNDRRIFETEEGGGLGRGFFVQNSEVGDASFSVTTFWYEYVCGNHRVWGASGVQELRIRHVGNADKRAFDELSVELRKYADASVKDDEAKVTAARVKVLGADKDTVLDVVFGLRVQDLSRKTIAASYDRAVEQEARYGNPRSVWGLTGGMTELARDLKNADARVTLERAAGKVLAVAF
jgi:hypothetical protein